MAVDLSQQPRREGVRHVWWDKANAPKVAWAERRRELTFVIRVPGPRKADFAVKDRLLSCVVTGVDGDAFRVDLPLKLDVVQGESGRSVQIGSTSVRLRIRKDPECEGLWQEMGDNITCLSIDPRESKSWLAYDWEVYKSDDESDDEVEGDAGGARAEPEEEEEEVVSRKAEDEPGERALESGKEAELRQATEAAMREATSRQQKRKQMLHFRPGQLAALAGMVWFICAVVTLLFTRWYYTPCVPAQ
eukprot:TRINITY_DN16134_c0_g1_i1.p1 TRINITY_DN16134_c0_g1~~TRINITY_DN16134_c0_g1_i1.p1  ORF type:complete len:247 (+),score=75.93 TRINITY_DN16134_c0_g1_i1:144-884(+)